MKEIDSCWRRKIDLSVLKILGDSRVKDAICILLTFIESAALPNTTIKLDDCVIEVWTSKATPFISRHFVRHFHILVADRRKHMPILHIIIPETRCKDAFNTYIAIEKVSEKLKDVRVKLHFYKILKDFKIQVGNDVFFAKALQNEKDFMRIWIETDNVSHKKITIMLCVSYLDEYCSVDELNEDDTEFYKKYWRMFEAIKILDNFEFKEKKGRFILHM